MQTSATFASRASHRLLRIGRAVVDGVLPPRCLSCGEIVEQPDALCSRCWSGITFFAPPWCVLCGLPFPHPMGEDAVCGDCARERPIWDQARAVLRYDKNSRRLLLGFKHGDHTHSAAAFGQWMQRAGADVLARADLLVPVPLHWTRLFQRRYNQAALLAQAVHAAGGPEVAADWLVRRRRTPVQGHLGPAARERNVRGAFAMRSRRSVAGKHLVVVDDVMTTGATVEECARVLRRAGALSISVLTLARALRTGA